MNGFLKEHIVRKFFSIGGGGGGGGGNSAAETTRRMDRYVKDTKADNKRLLDAIKGIASGMEGQVTTRSDEFLAGMSSEERTALDRLERANDWLTDQTNALSDTFSTEIRQVLDDLTAASTLLDDQERAAVANRIEQYRSEASQIDSDLQRTVGDTLGRFDTDSRAATAEFDTRSTGLGDTFLESARQALSDYGTAMDDAASLTPERLSLFTRAADYLSSAAQQTRQSLIDRADPNYRQMRDQVDAITAANLDGRIDSQTAGNLARSAAFRALGGGFSGSQMQRNLEARDLGLTAMELQNRGLSSFATERQRRFDTEVAGLQSDPTALLRDNQAMRQAQANTRLNTAMQTAESDRNQRQNALGTVFGSNLTRIDTRRADELNLGLNLANSASNRARETAGMDVTNLSNFYGNRRNLMGTQFNTGLNAAGRLFDVGLNTASSLYGTNVNATTDFFRTNANALGNVYATRVNAASQAAQMNANAQNAAAANLAAVRAGANAQIERAYQQDALLANQQVANNNQMWGSIFNMGSTLLGGFMGGMGGMGGGGMPQQQVSRFSSAGAAQSAAPYASSVNYFGNTNFGGMGWVPRASAA